MAEVSLGNQAKKGKKLKSKRKRQHQTKPERVIPRLNSTVAEFTLGKRKGKKLFAESF